MSGDALELTGKLSKADEATTSSYNIPVTIYNNTNVGFKNADVSIKDDDSNTTGEATFGRIEAHRSDTRMVSMPGGVEQAAYRISPDIGPDLVGVGVASNAPGVNIRISQ